MAEATSLRIRMQVVEISEDSRKVGGAVRQHAALDVELGRNIGCGAEVGQIGPNCTDAILTLIAQQIFFRCASLSDGAIGEHVCYT